MDLVVVFLIVDWVVIVAVIYQAYGIDSGGSSGRVVLAG